MKDKTYISGSYIYSTNIGKVRMSNEDRANALINDKGNIFLIVCDGMGGQNKGDYAAEIAVKNMCDAFQKKKNFLSKLDTMRWMLKMIRKTNSFIFNEASSDKRYSEMGTTLTALVLVRNFYVVAQIGDSRAYSLRNNQLSQITEDQTLVNYLYRTGKIKKEEIATHPKRHVLMNALGIYPSVDVEINSYNYYGETFLLCSDGLFNNVKENDIASILRGNDSVSQKSNELISLANSNGGSDNIAVVLWEASK